MCTKITTFLFILNAFFYFGQCTVTVSTTADSGPGSFRQAILTANACASGTTPVINFTISANSFITLLSDLPSLTHGNTTVDGTTAPGFSYPNSMVTLVWQGIDDCIQIQSGNNNQIKGLAFTNNFNGNGDASIRVNGGSNLLVTQCRAYLQDKNLVRVQGGTNVKVNLCTVENFWYNNGDSQRAFEVNSGSLVQLSNCTISNVARKVIEFNSSANGGTSGKISIYNNTFNHVGYGDSSICSPTPCGMNKGEHVISSYTNHTAIFSIRNNTLNSSFSKFIEIINSNGTSANRDSVYNNVINNCRGQHTIYIESNSGNNYGGIVIQNNTLQGNGINTYNVDQVIEIGGWANNYNNAKIVSNVISNYHGRGIMFRYVDNTQILNNQIYNCSKDQGIELNNNCDYVTIQGNYIGTNTSMVSGLSHFTSSSIQFNQCNNCQIGGDATLGEGNVVVAASNRRAIEVTSGSTGTTTIRGNKINTNGITTLSTSNEPAIHMMGTTAVIGGDSLIHGNFISGGSNATGIRIETSGATIQGNYIGCQAGGIPIASANLATGIRLDANTALVGSSTQNAYANKIGYCQKAILNSGQNNEWSRNQFWGNTANEVIDNSGSANGNVQPPTVISATLPYTVTGNATAGARVELYYFNQAFSCQGYQYIGSVTASSNGTWTYTAPNPITQSLAVLQVVGQNASEFSCFPISITPPPPSAPNAAFNLNANSICEGACITLNDLSTNNPTSWQWTASGGTLSGQGTSSASVCYNSPGTYTITLNVSNQGGNDSESTTVTVVSNPTISAPLTASYCQNASTVASLSATASGGISSSYSYQWFSNTTNSSTGGTAITGATAATYTPPVNNTGAFYYYCVASINPASTGCSVSSAVATITVNPGPTFTTQPQSQNICAGGTLNPLTVASAGGSGTPTYQWYSNTTNSISGGTPVGTSSTTYALPTSLTTATGTNYYYCQLTFSGSGGCSQVSSAIAAINVVADPIVSAPASQSICTGGTITPISVSASGGISSSYSYQWFSNTTNSSTGGTAITGATAATYTPPVNNTGAFYYYCVASINPASTGCSVSSAVATITVNPGPTFTTQPQSQNICAGGTLNPLTVASAGGSGTPTYQWYSNTTNSISGGTPVGTSSTTYALPTSLTTATGTNYYYCQLTFSGSGGCSQVSSAIAAINVVADPIVSAPASQSICTGGTITPISVTASGGVSSTYNYLWYDASGPISGATTASYTPPSSTGTYYCVVTNSPTTSGCSTNSANATVTVVANPTASAPLTASYCQNASTVASLSVTASGGISSSYSYQWYSNTTNSSTGVTAITGATAATYTPPVNNTGTFYYYCVISIDPASTGCSVSSAVATINVNPGPTFTTQPQSQNICAGGTLNPLTVASAGGSGTPTYQWYSNTTNSTSGGTPVGTSSTTYTLPTSLTTATGTNYYYCQLTFSGSVGCSQVSSAIAAINVVADPIVSAPASQSICLDAIPTAISVAASGGVSSTYDYQWYDASGPISGATNASYTPPSSAGTYYCVVTNSPATSGCSTNSANANIVILEPLGTITQEVSICDGESFTVGNSVYTMGGTYTDNLLTVFGCDSTIITILTVDSNSTSTIYDTICDGDSLAFADTILTQPGLYIDTSTNAWGCELITTLNLSVVDCSGSGLVELLLHNMIIYPLPSQGLVYAKIPDAMIGKLWIMDDITGRQVMSGRFNAKVNEFDMRGQSSGQYLIRVEEYGGAKVIILQ